MKITKSKFTGDTYVWGIFMLIPLGGLILFSVRILSNYSYKLGETLILLLFVTLFYFVMIFFKHIKLVAIEGYELKYYSLLCPFGKTLNLKDYRGKIITSESGSRGNYKVLYLVDKQNKTAFKFMGLHYKNFDEINEAIELKKITFHPGLRQYLKLLFLERIEIKEEDSKRDTLKIILNVFKYISIIGVSLFAIGMIIKQIF